MQQVSSSALYAPPRVLLRAEQVAERLGIGKSSWDKWVSSALVEQGISVGSRTVVWDSWYIDSLIEKILRGEFTTAGLYAEKGKAS